MPDTTLNTPSWGLAYLRGRAEAFQRGRVTLNNVAGGVRLALRCHADMTAVRAVLAEHALEWDAETRVLRAIA